MFNTQSEAQQYAANLMPSKLVALCNKLDNAYYNKTPIVRDSIYDIIREVAIARQGESKLIADYLKKVGHKPTREFVTLPHRMPSLDKIKPGNGSVAKWVIGKKRLVILDKFDGVAGLLVYERGQLPDLYSRGTDDEGQNINRLRTHLDIPKTLNVQIAVRGEIIIPEALFKSKYLGEKGELGKYSNPRSMVIGLTGKLKGDVSAVKDFHYVAYQIKGSKLKPSDQIEKLKALGFNVPKYVTASNINDETLSAYLAKRRKASHYEIDGLVIHNDTPTSEEEYGNPKNSISFKVNTSDEMVEAVVTSVTWNVSKNGRINPQVNIVPIKTKGVTISNLTGHNAFFIAHGYTYKDRAKYNKAMPIGKGAVLLITRSGDVIPKIESVVIPVKKPNMPTIQYEYDENGVFIYTVDDSQDTQTTIKQLSHFFTTLDVEGLKEANVKVLVENGYTTIPDILAMDKDDFFALPRFQDTLATKLYTNIKTAIKNCSIEQFADASGVFGIGIGTRRCKVIFDAYPDILHYTIKQARSLIIELPGFKDATTESFLSGVKEFKALIKETGITFKAKPKVGLHYSNINVCFTGIRSKEAEALITKGGGTVSSSVTKNTNLVVTKDVGGDSDKLKKARSLGITIITLDTLLKLK